MLLASCDCHISACKISIVETPHAGMFLSRREVHCQDIHHLSVRFKIVQKLCSSLFYASIVAIECRLYSPFSMLSLKDLPLGCLGNNRENNIGTYIMIEGIQTVFFSKFLFSIKNFLFDCSCKFSRHLT